MTQSKQVCDTLRQNIGKVLVGKSEVIDLLMIALMCSGHVLLEDVPGLGKTVMAKTLAKSIDGAFNRIQFTPDLLPSDVTGINFYNQKEGAFEFRKGPLFSQIVLADEINRATPRTQSSLLEAMEERQVSVDGTTYILDRPFMVLATQNPIESQGTFPLPEAQMDRFLMRISMGYPTANEEVEILRRVKDHHPIEDIAAVINTDVIIQMQKEVTGIHVSEAVAEYIVDICQKTRNHPKVLMGVSPRGAIALMKTSQAKALLEGRTFVLPDDVQAMAPHVLGHRLILENSHLMLGMTLSDVVSGIVSEVVVPVEEGIA